MMNDRPQQDTVIKRSLQDRFFIFFIISAAKDPVVNDVKKGFSEETFNIIYVRS
jgi:hypothetical protein